MGEMQVVIAAAEELAKDAGKPQWEGTPTPVNEALKNAVTEAMSAGVAEAYRITDKQARYTRLGELRNQAVADLAGEESEFSADDVKAEFAKLEKNTVRTAVVAGEPRIDGRDNKTVRPIAVEVGVLPNVHGSALFTRGETQALVVATLGSARDAQIIGALEGERRDNFMLHYNFPC